MKFELVRTCIYLAALHGQLFARSRSDIRHYVSGSRKFEGMKNVSVITCSGCASDTAILYRILGNNIPGRHSQDQTITNLQRIIDHEHPLQNCEKRFVLNRIVDISLEAKIAELLLGKGLRFLQIMFESHVYQRIALDVACFSDPKHFLRKSYYTMDIGRRMRDVLVLYRQKNIYVMNNNGARNLALQDGKHLADWILPWDGNCFMDHNAWTYLYNNMTQKMSKYFTVPMCRLRDFPSNLNMLKYAQCCDEPQIAFHRSSELSFNEAFPYGFMPKAELLFHLGTPGPWQKWLGRLYMSRLNCFNRTNRSHKNRLPRLDQSVSWVARLPSGYPSQEVGRNARAKRTRARGRGILGFLMDLDMKLEAHNFSDMIFTDEKILLRERNMFWTNTSNTLQTKINELVHAATEALDRGPFSVMDKISTPPSGDKHDYFSAAPYFWPVTNERNETVFLHKDGHKHPSTEMYSVESGLYDRSTLQRVFDDSSLTALAWYFTGSARFAKHGVELMEVFFLKAETKMNPHMKFAQYRSKVSSFGIIEMKDLYYYLDAVRLLQRSGEMTPSQILGFKDWLRAYSKWLQHSHQGLEEMTRTNNHGIYFDLQLAAIAAYLENRLLLAESLARSLSRIPDHFTSEGVQSQELRRPLSKHYCTFNLMAWMNMAMLSKKFGSPILSNSNAHSGRIRRAIKLLLEQRKKWPYPYMGKFDEHRFVVVAWMSGSMGHVEEKRGEIFNLPSVFYPHDGVKPYWNLGLKSLEVKE